MEGKDNQKGREGGRGGEGRGGEGRGGEGRGGRETNLHNSDVSLSKDQKSLNDLHLNIPGVCVYMHVHTCIRTCMYATSMDMYVLTNYHMKIKL